MKNNYKDLFRGMIDVLNKYGSIVIYIQGSPDPDAMGSSFAIKKLCDLLGIRADIVAAVEPSLPQNRAMISRLGIHLKYEKSAGNLDQYDAYAVVDFQSAHVKGLSGKIPCALHIDHHEEIDEDVKVDLKMTGTGAGSVSSMIGLALRESDFQGKESILADAATALVLGIQTDTDNYRHAGDDDFLALAFLSPYSDHKIINDISGIPFSDVTINLLKKARAEKILYKDWLIAGVGFISDRHRDSIAIIADFLIREEGCTTAVVFALVEKNGGKNLVLDASVRTKDSDLDLDFLIKQITQEGGGRPFKGAYQVNLDYFVNCPNRDMLWDLVSRTTGNVITRLRDNIHLIELKGFYRGVRRKISSLFRGSALLALVLALACGPAACARKFGMVRAMHPAERLDVEINRKHGCALIRHRDFDAAAQEIGLAEWEHLLKHELFLKKKGHSEARIPRLHFFHLALTNAGKVPLKIGEILIRYGGREAQAMTTSEVLDRCKSPAYAAINMKSLLGMKRYLGDKWCIREIDYSAHVIDYLPDVVLPGDCVILVAAFGWVPVQYRDIRLVIKVRQTGQDREKTVDFDFKRLEFRTRGGHFTRGKETSSDK
jgi:nanoRNase/pAp phosphatase (c-di-AMP/oligoRNAs hydrolase)